jgi:hypothetical protein
MSPPSEKKRLGAGDEPRRALVRPAVNEIPTLLRLVGDKLRISLEAVETLMNFQANIAAAGSDDNKQNQFTTRIVS